MKKSMKPEMMQCVRELFHQFWVLKKTDKQLYYLIRDNENELRDLFSDRFRYQLIVTNDFAKLEKIPVTLHQWMSETDFSDKKDYVFFFCLLAYLEGRTSDQQFLLRDICENLAAYYQSVTATEEEAGEILGWKQAGGYKNRLSLIRVLKYAVKMNLIEVIDQHIEDFSRDSEHDVLFQRTVFVPYFMKGFGTDIKEWDTLEGIDRYLQEENNHHIDDKHRYYRRLFLEPMVYQEELSEGEKEYVKRYYPHVESFVDRYTDMQYERYPSVSMMVTAQPEKGQLVHPNITMISKLTALFASYIKMEYGDRFQGDVRAEMELTPKEIYDIVSELKEQTSDKWTKEFREQSKKVTTQMLIRYLCDWKFATEKNENVFLCDGLFRVMGEYHNEG